MKSTELDLLLDTINSNINSNPVLHNSKLCLIIFLYIKFFCFQDDFTRILLTFSYALYILMIMCKTITKLWAYLPLLESAKSQE